MIVSCGAKSILFEMPVRCPTTEKGSNLSIQSFALTIIASV